MVGMRWAIRCVGLVSTLILARILTPEDFGIVAMATIVLGLLQVCSEMGAAQLLLRMGETDRSAWDTAWTIGLVQALILGTAMFFLAYPASVYFKEPRLVAVMQVISATSIITGFANVGVVMFRRDLDFRRDFMFGFYAKVVSVIPTVVLALVYRSYWALVVGNIIAGLLHLILSYTMHPFRPRLSFAEWRRFVSFSAWITPSHIANYLAQKVDVFVVGYIANTAQMGAYNVAAELSRIASTEIVQPIARAIYPNYAKLKDDLAELTRAFLIVTRTVAIICFSSGLGIAAVADDIVHVVLGDQWGFAVPLIGWLGVMGAFAALFSAMMGHILIVLRKEHVWFMANVLKLAVIAASVLTAAHFGGVLEIAMAAALAMAAITLASVFILPRMLTVSAGRILMEIFRVFLTALVMFLAVRLLHSYEIKWRLVTLLIDTATGVVVFGTVLYLSWLAAGRPDGPERRLVDLASRKLRQIRRS